MAHGALTSYCCGGNAYSSYILGGSIDEVTQKAQRRALGEIVDSNLQDVELLPDYNDLNDYDFLLQLPQITHTACFMGFVASKAGTVSIEELLSDDGIIHELVHLMSGSVETNHETLSKIRSQLKSLQQKAIGFYEPV